MNVSWSRHIARTLVSLGAVAALAACGGGSVVSPLNPERIITLGDGFMDVGQTRTDGQAPYYYTVNDGTSPQIWVEDLAVSYGKTVTAPGNTGNPGFGYAQGGACVTQTGTADCYALQSVTQQVDALLASTSLAANDLILINGGVSDIVNAYKTSANPTSAVQQAARDLGALVGKLRANGARHVLVVNSYNVGATPWAAAQPGFNDYLNNPIYSLVRTFNDTLKSSLASYTDKTVLYFDAEYLHDRMYYYATQSNGTWTYNAGACTVQLSSQKCTTDTLLPSTTTTTGYVDYSTYLFADSLYPTPVASHSFAYDTYATGVISFIRYYW